MKSIQIRRRWIQVKMLLTLEITLFCFTLRFLSLLFLSYFVLEIASHLIYLVTLYGIKIALSTVPLNNHFFILKKYGVTLR